MRDADLLKFKSNVHSQNGEDGIIQEIFRRIGTTTKTCCEFGAWDGIHLSNCRQLILGGWSALMIEGDTGRFDDLVRNYKDNPSVVCVNRFVDAGANSLSRICQENPIRELDFLSIDIDGLDYEIFEMLDLHPRVICIEVNAGHSPITQTRLNREVAAANVGQSLSVFVGIANEKSYDLVCYSGNAFFVRRDANKQALAVLTSAEAYANFLGSLSAREREWLYLVNTGDVEPFHKYDNPSLTRTSLSLGLIRAALLKTAAVARRTLNHFRHH